MADEQPCMNQEQLEGLEKDIYDGISMIVSVKHYEELEASEKDLRGKIEKVKIIIKEYTDGKEENDKEEKWQRQKGNR